MYLHKVKFSFHMKKIYMFRAKRTGNGTKYNVQIGWINLALQVTRVLLIISTI